MSEAAQPQSRTESVIGSHRVTRADHDSQLGDDVVYDCVVLGLDLAHALLDRERGVAWPLASRVHYFEDAIDPAASGALYSRLRAFLAQKGVTELIPLGGGGSAHAEVVETGAVRPGRIVLGSGGAGYAAGALGALYLERSPFDLAAELELGSARLPAGRHIATCSLIGSPERFAAPLDVALAIRERLDPTVFAYEITGDYLDRLELPDRLLFAASLGGASRRPVLLRVDQKTITWLRARSGARLDEIGEDVAPLAQRDSSLAPSTAPESPSEIGIGSVLPSVAREGRAEAIVDLDEIPIRAVLVGGAFGAQLHELRVIAHFLREHPVHRDVRFVVVPATVKTMIHAIHEGILGVLLRAGVRVEAPGARGTERLQRALLGHAEHGLTTACDSPLPPGWSLASASTCVASAIIGRIAHPDEVVRRRKESV